MRFIPRFFLVCLGKEKERIIRNNAFINKVIFRYSRTLFQISLVNNSCSYFWRGFKPRPLVLKQKCAASRTVKSGMFGAVRNRRCLFLLFCFFLWNLYCQQERSICSFFFHSDVFFHQFFRQHKFYQTCQRQLPLIDDWYLRYGRLCCRVADNYVTSLTKRWFHAFGVPLNDFY